MTSLGTSLFSELTPKFFGVLAGGNASIYLTVLDLVERELGARPEALERDEVVAMVADLFERGLLVNPCLAADEDAIPEQLAPKERARLVIDRLRDAGWLREEAQSDWRRLLFFDENAAVVLEALRKIGQPPGIVVFSDKLINVCVTVCGSALSEDPWPQLLSCRSLLEDGLKELRLMGKSIERHTRRQLDAGTLRDNLSLVFDEFAGNISSACYAELVRARLPSRLAEARHALDRMQSDAVILDRMQTELMKREQHRNLEIDSATAMARVRNEIDALAAQLSRVVPLADEIDRRASDFARKSLARFRYLQEVASERREAVQTLFETLNRAFAGKSYREMEPLSLPPLRISDVRCFSGLESLFTPRLRRQGGEIEPLDDEPTQKSLDHVRLELHGALRDSITLGRANRFVANLEGDRVSSRDIPMPTPDDLGDLIACLLLSGANHAKYRLEFGRIRNDEARPTFHPKSDYLLEEFTVIKKK